MRAIVQTGPSEVGLQERERPDPEPSEALIRVHSAGICGSDAHAYRYHHGYEFVQLPRIMGHEYAGEVVETGAAVDQVSVGDLVVEEPLHPCGECFQCRSGQANVCQEFSITGIHTDGAYAEYRAVPVEYLHVVPEVVPAAHAAITEPLSVAARAVFERSPVSPGDTVMVAGPGPIGTFIAAVADRMGAEVVVSGLSSDASYRLPLIADIGIETINIERTGLSAAIDARTDGIGCDVVFDATGHHRGIESAVQAVRKGGQIVVVGLPNDDSELFLTPVVRGEIDIRTSYASQWRNFDQALRLLAQAALPIDRILDHSVSVSDPGAAFESFLAGETCKPVFSFASESGS